MEDGFLVRYDTFSLICAYGRARSKAADTANTVASSPGVIAEDNIIIYPYQKNLLIAFEDGRYALLEVIANADAPNVFQYRVDIGSGQTISTDYSGGYSVIDKTGEQVAFLWGAVGYGL